MTKKQRTAGPPPHRPKATTAPHQPAPARPKAERPIAEANQVVLAAVAGAHGLGGEVKLKLFADDLTPYLAFNGGKLTVVSIRGTIARFAEITDRSAAEALRGTALTVARAELPPLSDGEFYHSDMIGLPVQLLDGTAVGHIVAVENFGAGDVVEIERSDGKQFMVPLRPEAVPEWNSERLVLDPAFLA